MVKTQSNHEPLKPSDLESPKQVPDKSKREDDEEFEITIKKLDTVVRPRGVLAE
jgi:hypothetical protein